jgi:peptidoglycan/xylan/chitin deacetylase (PgdA/CDA1 family)
MLRFGYPAVLFALALISLQGNFQSRNPTPQADSPHSIQQSAQAKPLPSPLRRPIPDHLVVLTFDDAPVSDITLIAPILKKYDFGTTFFICEFPPHFADKSRYMSWEQVRELNDMGFEIGNHTAFHTHVSKMSRDQFRESLTYIEDKARSYGIPAPVTFAYPGYDVHSKDLDLLTERHYLFARAGGERPYDPLRDNALLIPGINGNGVDEAHVIDALSKARDGKIVVMTFHGVPDAEHPWVSTDPKAFERYMRYLYENHYVVIAMRNLTTYIDPAEAMKRTASP